MGEARITQLRKVLSTKPEMKKYLEDLDVDGSVTNNIILKNGAACGDWMHRNQPQGIFISEI